MARRQLTSFEHILLSEHHRLIRHELARFRGREIDTAGDGFLAASDGPARALRADHSHRVMAGYLSGEQCGHTWPPWVNRAGLARRLGLPRITLTG
jgi:class 3 adenylate cyclase